MVVVIGFIVGLILGSFVECISRRSLGKTGFWGRSFCDSCKKKLSWYDLIPVISFVFLSGKCRYCHKKIETQTILVELIMALVVAIFFGREISQSFSVFNLDSLVTFWPTFVFKLFFLTTLAILFLTDLRSGLIPDRVSVSAIKISLGYLLCLTMAQIGYLYYSLNSSLMGKILISQTDYFSRHSFYIIQSLLSDVTAALLSFLFFGGLILVTKGRGMGGGDLKLGVLIGLVLGFPEIIVALLLSFILGSIVGVGLIITRVKSLGETIPFGPFLTLGAFITLLWGQEILNWYLRFKLL